MGKALYIDINLLLQIWGFDGFCEDLISLPIGAKRCAVLSEPTTVAGPAAHCEGIHWLRHPHPKAGRVCDRSVGISWWLWCHINWSDPWIDVGKPIMKHDISTYIYIYLLFEDDKHIWPKQSTHRNGDGMGFCCWSRIRVREMTRKMARARAARARKTPRASRKASWNWWVLAE